MATNENIKVVIKARPLIKREREQKLQPLWRIQGETIECISPLYNNKYSFGECVCVCVCIGQRCNIIDALLFAKASIAKCLIGGRPVIFCHSTNVFLATFDFLVAAFFCCRSNL